jgi:hypothetical protein
MIERIVESADSATGCDCANAVLANNKKKISRFNIAALTDALRGGFVRERGILNDLTRRKYPASYNKHIIIQPILDILGVIFGLEAFMNLCPKAYL